MAGWIGPENREKFIDVNLFRANSAENRRVVAKLPRVAAAVRGAVAAGERALTDLVLVPGLATTAEVFAETLARLAPTGRAMVARPGDHDDIGPLAAAILAEAPPRFALVGLSMGGYVALEILRRAAGRVDALVLLSTTARPDDAATRRRRIRQIAIAEAGRYGALAALQPAAVLAADALDRHGAAVRRMAEETGAAAFVRQQTVNLSRPDFRPDLAGIAAPTLVMAGGADRLAPPDRAAEIAVAVPGARLVVVEGAGHLLPLERPDAVAAAVADHLAAVR